MNDMEARFKQFDGVIEELIAETQNEYNETMARVNELNAQLQEKDMLTDRSENASFQVAKDERDFKSNVAELLQRRINALRQEVGNHRESATVILGSVVELHVVDISGASMNNVHLPNNFFKIVSHDTSNARKGLLAIDSKVGQAIKGARAGETVVVSAPLGSITYKVERIY